MIVVFHEPALSSYKFHIQIHDVRHHRHHHQLHHHPHPQQLLHHLHHHRHSAFAIIIMCSLYLSSRSSIRFESAMNNLSSGNGSRTKSFLIRHFLEDTETHMVVIFVMERLHFNVVTSFHFTEPRPHVGALQNVSQAFLCEPLHETSHCGASNKAHYQSRCFISI